MQNKLGDILDKIEKWFGSFILARSPHAEDVLTLWTLHTHALRYVNTSPRLLFTSAVPGCGKTTALEHLERLCNNTLMSSHATPALIARVVDSQLTTLLLDETDNLLNKGRDGVNDMYATLNSGYRKGGKRSILVSDGKQGWRPTDLSTYAAAAMAGIGTHLPDALSSRTIPIELDRARQGQVQNTAWDLHGDEAQQLHDELQSILREPEIVNELQNLSKDHTVEIDGLFGRDREVWMPLLSLAHVAGDAWYERAIDAMTWFLADAEDAQSLKPKMQKIQLLEDLLLTWQEEPPTASGFVSSQDLVIKLQAINPDQWGFNARYGELKPKRLASMLNEYGVRPQHNHDRTKRGYLWGDFKDPWARYLPDAWRQEEEGDAT